MGILRSYESWSAIIQNKVHDGVHYPGLWLLESLELFLIGMMFFIFSIGMAQLFLPNFDREKFQNHVPSWFQLDNFSQLKLILWETILTTLVVYTVTELVEASGDYDWNMLIIPAMILAISLALLILRFSERHIENKSKH